MSSLRELEKLSFSELLAELKIRDPPLYWEKINEYTTDLIDSLLDPKERLDRQLQNAVSAENIDESIRLMALGARVSDYKNLISRLAWDQDYKNTSLAIANGWIPEDQFVDKIHEMPFSHRLQYILLFLASKVPVPFSLTKDISSINEVLREKGETYSLNFFAKNATFIWPDQLDVSYRYLDPELIEILKTKVPSRLKYQAQLVWPDRRRVDSLRDQSARAAVRHHLTDEEVANLTEISELLP